MNANRFTGGNITMNHTTKTNIQETTDEFRQKLGDMSKIDKLDVLVTQKLQCLNKHSSSSAQDASQYKFELERLNTLAVHKELYAVGGDSWHLLSKMLDSSTGCAKINDFFATCIDFPNNGAINHTIIFVEPLVERAHLQSLNGNTFVVFSSIS